MPAQIRLPWLPSPGSPPLAGKVELEPTSQYYTHKRNLLLACSLVVVFYAADHQTSFKIMGLDASLSPRTAFTLLAVAVCYFFVQYIIEYRITRERHRDVSVGNSIAAFDKRLTEQFSELEHQVSALNDAVGRVKNSLDETSKKLPGRGSIRRHIHDVAVFSGKAQPVENEWMLDIEPPAGISTGVWAAILNELDKKFEQIRLEISKSSSSFYHISSELRKIDEEMNRFSDNSAQLVIRLRKISVSVYGMHRLGHRWIDGYLVWAYTILSIGLCIARIA